MPPFLPQYMPLIPLARALMVCPGIDDILQFRHGRIAPFDIRCQAVFYL